MINVKNNILNIKNPNTGQYESVPAIVGSSAYQIAVKNGFHGTEKEWLDSLLPNEDTISNFVKSGPGAKSGLVPAPPTTAGTTKYLREDGTWSVPPNTTGGDVIPGGVTLMSVEDFNKLFE